MKKKINILANPVSESHSVMSDSLQPHGLYSPWNSPDQHTGVGSLSLLQGLFPTQGSNPGLPHCRWILYQPSHKGSPKVKVTQLCLTHCDPMDYFGQPNMNLGEGNGNPLHYSCQENPMDREAWWASVHAVTKNQT